MLIYFILFFFVYLVIKSKFVYLLQGYKRYFLNSLLQKGKLNCSPYKNQRVFFALMELFFFVSYFFLSIDLQVMYIYFLFNLFLQGVYYLDGFKT